MDDIINRVKAGYSKQTKMKLVEEIGKIGREAKIEGKKKLTCYLISLYLFIISIAFIIGIIIGVLG